MGDRANIYIETPKSHGGEGKRATVGGIYLYTHWAGTEFPEMLREALEFGRGRWNDDHYLNRIIVSRVFRDIVDSETGGGMGLTIGDNEHLITVVDVTNQTVSWAEEDDETTKSKRFGQMSFADYVAQTRATYPEKRA